MILAPNHCRLSDPLTFVQLSRIAKCDLHAMASWHLFMESRLSRFMLRRVGAFSVYREGVDRQAINTAVDILVDGKRPLVIFAEGAISRHNDELMPLMDGTAFIARTAAKRREKIPGAGGVVIHPVAIRYFFKGDIEATVTPVLEEIESHFSWFPQQDKPLVQRLRQIGQALLSLKEIEYFGSARMGDFYQRVDALIEDVADAIASGELLDDPLSLRPFPLCGLRGWPLNTRRRPNELLRGPATGGCMRRLAGSGWLPASSSGGPTPSQPMIWF